MAETQTLPGPWQVIFFDGRTETGQHVGVIEKRRVIAEAPCIGCTMHRTHPEDAVTRTYEVWANGQREFDQTGCHCDAMSEAGFTPWRLTPHGTLSHRELVCSCCQGNGSHQSKAKPMRSYPCSKCQGTGWLGKAE